MPLKKSSAVRDLGIRSVPLPHNIEAEEAVVGGILLQGDCISQVIDLLAPCDFYAPVLEAVYTAMDSLARPKAGAPTFIDPVTVSEALDNLDLMGHLKPHGGSAYLWSLQRKVGTVQNLMSWAVLVKRYARARAVMFKGSEIYQQAGDAADFDEWARTAYSELGELVYVDDGTEPTHFRQDLHVLIKDVEERFHTRSTRSLVSGVPTGIAALDEKTGGLQAEYILLTGRPSMGKSAFMSHLQGAAGEAGIPSLTFSLEMSRLALTTRIAAQRARVKTEDLKTAMLNQHDWISLTRALGSMSQWPLFMDDGPQTIGSLRDKARRWRRKFSQRQCPVCNHLVNVEDAACGAVLVASGEQGQGCGSARPASGWPLRKAIIFLDYLGRLPLQVAPGGSEEKALANISRQLKDIPKELQLSLVVLTQLNRKCEERKDKRPMNSDLRDSGSLEQDADVILHLYRDEVYNEDTDSPNIAEIIIGKQRNGPTCTVKAVYLKEYGPRFENLSQRSYP